MSQVYGLPHVTDSACDVQKGALEAVCLQRVWHLKDTVSSSENCRACSRGRSAIHLCCEVTSTGSRESLESTRNYTPPVWLPDPVWLNSEENVSKMKLRRLTGLG